jgi:hypothetical protein
MSLAEAEPPRNSKKVLPPPLLLNGTSDFIETDTLAAITSVGSGSGAALAVWLCRGLCPWLQ